MNPILTDCVQPLLHIPRDTECAVRCLPCPDVPARRLPRKCRDFGAVVDTFADGNDCRRQGQAFLIARDLSVDVKLIGNSGLLRHRDNNLGCTDFKVEIFQICHSSY